MPYVEILKLQDDDTQKVIVTCHLQGDEVVCDGDPTFCKNLKEKGIRDFSQAGDAKLFPKDGLKFLQQLRPNIRSGYYMATAIKE